MDLSIHMILFSIPAAGTQISHLTSVGSCIHMVQIHTLRHTIHTHKINIIKKKPKPKQTIQTNKNLTTIIERVRPHYSLRESWCGNGVEGRRGKSVEVGVGDVEGGNGDCSGRRHTDSKSFSSFRTLLLLERKAQTKEMFWLSFR